MSDAFEVFEALKIIAKSPLAIGGLVVSVIISLMIGIWVFRPVDRAAKDREHPTQFTIIDFFCLFFIIQLAMAIIHWQLGLGAGAQMTFVYLLDSFACFACGALWMKSVQFMSRAGIQKPWHRVLFLAVIIPGTLITVMTAPALLSFRLEIMAITPTNEDHLNLPATLAILAALPPILYLLAMSTRKIVAAAKPPPLVRSSVEMAKQSKAGAG